MARKTNPKQTERSRVGRSVFIFIFIALFGLIVLFTALTGRSLCVVYSGFGVPCPSCGMTRAWLHVLHGRFGDAFRFHPLWWAVPFVILPYVPFKNKKIPPQIRNQFFVAFIVLFASVWAVRMALYFPHTPPMDFNRRAVAPTIFRWLHGLIPRFARGNENVVAMLFSL